MIETSDEMDKIASALVEFQASVSDPKKNSTNPHFRSSFVGLEDTISVLRPQLARHGLSLTQWLTEGGLTTMILHTSGQFVRSHADLMLEKKTPQGMGSAITYGRRQAYLAVTGTAGDVDDDAEAAEAPHRAPKPAEVPQDTSEPDYVPEAATALVDGFSRRLGEANNMDELKACWTQIQAAPLSHEQKQMLKTILDMSKERV